MSQTRRARAARHRLISIPTCTADMHVPVLTKSASITAGCLPLLRPPRGRPFRGERKSQLDLVSPDVCGAVRRATGIPRGGGPTLAAAAAPPSTACCGRATSAPAASWMRIRPPIALRRPAPQVRSKSISGLDTLFCMGHHWSTL